MSAQAARVVERGIEVVDAAGPHHHQEPVVLAVEDRVDLRAPAQDDVDLLAGQGQLVEQPLGRDERLDPLDPPVADRIGRARRRQSHRSLPSAAAARTRSA